MVSEGRYNGHNDCYQALANTRKDLHEEIGLMFQFEAKTTKALIQTIRSEFHTQLKEVKARAELRREIGTGAGTAKDRFRAQHLATPYRNKLKQGPRMSENPWKNLPQPSNRWPTSPTLQHLRTI